LEKALVYDLNLGTHSVGTHVRDAACYVCWSFARAYSPEIMKPHVATLSTKLIVVALFDREINIRRAASATFQEAVGRQGNFPHGIEILTEADYFTLSIRVNAYLNVSTYVAQFEDYREEMFNQLAFVQLQHWEPAMRELASQALAVISVYAPKLVIEKILPKLLSSCFHKVLNVRHGALLGVAEIIRGLSGNSGAHRAEILERAMRTLSLKERDIIKEETAEQKEFKSMYENIASINCLAEVMPAGSEMRKKVTGLIKEIEDQKLYKGKGGEIIRNAVCHLIDCLCAAKIDYSEDDKLMVFMVLKENFKHPNVEIQKSATNALRSYCGTYFQDPSTLSKDSPAIKEIMNLFKQFSVENSAQTRGLNMALGVLSDTLLKNKELGIADIMFGTLLQNCLPKGAETDDAESRKQAIKSLA